MSESNISDQVRSKLSSLKGLKNRLSEMSEYLSNVESGRLPVNHSIIYNLQDIFNLLPNVKEGEQLSHFAHHVNDNLMVIYVSALIRSIAALHDLIQNKLINAAWEKEEGKTEEEKKADKKKKEEEEKKKKEAEEKKKKEEEEKKKASGKSKKSKK